MVSCVEMRTLIRRLFYSSPLLSLVPLSPLHLFLFFSLPPPRSFVLSSFVILFSKIKLNSRQATTCALARQLQILLPINEHQQ